MSGASAVSAAGIMAPWALATILIVDDEAAIATALAGGMRRRGFKVMTASEGSAALRIIQNGEDIDLMVTDVMMPIMNGIELARASVRLRPAMAVLLSTGYAFDVVEDLGGHHDEFPILFKPYTVATLVARVREMLAKPLQ